MFKNRRWLLALVITFTVLATIRLMSSVSADTDSITYDIVYIRQPRNGDNQHIIWPEVIHPGRIEPDTDLMLLHPDGSEEVLVAGGDGAVTDPFISFDGLWVYYSYFHNVLPENLNYQRGYLSELGADVYRINIATRQIEQLTFGEFTPNTGNGNWDESNPLDPASGYNYLGYGILNLGPAPLAGGKIAFVSNRNGFMPPKSYTAPTLQLFIMDEDGANVTPIAPMTIGSALHPTPLSDGRIIFSSFETQGLRDSRQWSIWSIWPDGRNWQPVASSFKQSGSFHFMTQLTNDDIVIEDYYNQNNFGFGALYRFPVSPPAGTPAFYSAFLDDNPPLTMTAEAGYLYPYKMAFSPYGAVSISEFTHANDNAAPFGDDGLTRVGKFTHPSAAPANDLLVAWSDGPANSLQRPTDLPAVDAGLYIIPNGDPVSSPDDLVLIKNDPNYNEVWPRAVVPYQDVHGIAEPVELPWLPNDGLEHVQLPAGTPYGLIGTSSFYKRESFPGNVNSDTFDGLDAFNTYENEQSSNWFWQGSDAGKYDNSDIWAVRIVMLEPNAHRSYGPNNGQHFYNHVNEKMRILGEIPLRKFDGNGDPILDPEGNPDTSFLAKIPADTPFTFHMLDRNNMVLNVSQTWHQVRPGEVRQDCGGCHAHSQQPLAFENTAAADPAYQVWDLINTTPMMTHDAAGDPDLDIQNVGVTNVEFYQDIRPILTDHCISCHTQTDPNPPGNLVLDDYTMYETGDYVTYDQLPGDYARLCHDPDSDWGYPALVTVGGDPVWRQTNASRYVRKFQSRRSLLLWKVFGDRLDGWENGDHPSATILGDPNSLPAGAHVNESDLDFRGTMMPPPASGVAALTIDEKMTVARWVDMGCPINTGTGGDEDFGWFIDDLRPTVELSLPRPSLSHTPLTMIRVGLVDVYSGLDMSTLSMTATTTINGVAAGGELAALLQPAGGGIYTLPLSQAIDSINDAILHVEIKDNEGNITRIDRKFSIQAVPTAVEQQVLASERTIFPSLLVIGLGLLAGLSAIQKYRKRGQ